MLISYLSRINNRSEVRGYSGDFSLASQRIQRSTAIRQVAMTPTGDNDGPVTGASGDLRQVADRIAHDLNNLLSVVRNYASFIADESSDAAKRADSERWTLVHRDAQQIEIAVERALLIVAERIQPLARDDARRRDDRIAPTGQGSRRAAVRSAHEVVGDGVTLSASDADEVGADAQLMNAVLDSLMDNVAVISRDGTIVAVNNAWREFGRRNGASDTVIDGVGLNHLTGLSNEIYPPSRLTAGMESVLSGVAATYRVGLPLRQSHGGPLVPHGHHPAAEHDRKVRGHSSRRHSPDRGGARPSQG